MHITITGLVWGGGNRHIPQSVGEWGGGRAYHNQWVSVGGGNRHIPQSVGEWGEG